jgi:Tol biopolymer transport system component
MKAMASVLMVLVASAALPEGPPSVLEGDYLGQAPPGLTRQVFAPGIVSTEAPEGCLCFSNDGSYAVFRRHWREKTVVLISERKHGRWSEPEVAPFFMRPYRFGDFTFAPNALRLYFTSNRPTTEGGEPTDTSDIWMVDNVDGAWTQPVHLPSPVSSALHDSYPSVSDDGTLYFFRRFDPSSGRSEILSAEPNEDGYSEPVNLGSNINTEWDEWDPFVSSDGETLIFCSKKPSGRGEDDLYVSFKDTDGRWSTAINLGEGVNTPSSENRPFITADGKYLFFSAGDAAGGRDVYWVNMEVVRRLRR